MQHLANDSLLFTGQYFDCEIEEYYLRARQYNPRIARFTSRDPVAGKFKEPLTLHKYAYSSNDPVNRTDPSGKWAVLQMGVSRGWVAGLYGRQKAAMNFYGVEEGTYNVFFGTLESKGSGLDVGVVLISAGITVGWAENAQRPEDLAGAYTEIGGSAGAYFVGGGYAYAYSREKDVGIHLMTVGGSLGTAEFHWFEGDTEVLWSDSWGD